MQTLEMLKCIPHISLISPAYVWLRSTQLWGKTLNAPGKSTPLSSIPAESVFALRNLLIREKWLSAKFALKPLQFKRAYRDTTNSSRAQGDFSASPSFAAAFEASEGTSGEWGVAWELPAEQSWIYWSKDLVWISGWGKESLGRSKGYFYWMFNFPSDDSNRG